MLKSKTIYLRAVEKDDLTRLMIWENNPKHWKVSGTEVPFSTHALLQYIEQAQHIRQHGQIRFMICLNDTNEPVGCIDLFDANFKHQRAAIGILIAEEGNRNHGYAGEALDLVLQYAEQIVALRNLYCSIHSDNPASIRLFEKAGFERVGVRKDWFYEGHQWIDEIIYQKCLKEEKY